MYTQDVRFVCREFVYILSLLLSIRWQDSRIWKVRTWLMFIVDHLQYYLQVDVLESQWNILETAFESSRDFEAIRHAHMNFLASTLSQTFLLLGSVSKKVSYHTIIFHQP